MDTATEKFQVCMASKLPRVVPTRTRSGLVHDLGTRGVGEGWVGLSSVMRGPGFEFSSWGEAQHGGKGDYGGGVGWCPSHISQSAEPALHGIASEIAGRLLTYSIDVRRELSLSNSIPLHIMCARTVVHSQGMVEGGSPF
ncbi:hypothetical protein TIFTF001_035923 [Ficus carica]|uniref:Uncharacterized protein n=1 Tax=Ficus carica TaxID=3494 RepID=A0AA88J715_FICCA|nr:hypothetical protein TIFTF001_035923 [Ficus carica]